MTIYFTSDNHWHHKKIIEFEERPFDTLEELNEGMIENWNKTVHKNDTVYHLGDFCFGRYDKWVEILSKLNGKIILIKGNHDKDSVVKRLHEEGYLHEYHLLGTIIKSEKMILNLSHYPMMIGIRPQNFSIFGHIHSHETGQPNHINVGVDSQFAKKLDKPFGTPISMTELMQRVHELNPLVKEAKLKQREENL